MLGPRELSQFHPRVGELRARARCVSLYALWLDGEVAFRVQVEAPGVWGEKAGVVEHATHRAQGVRLAGEALCKEVERQGEECKVA
jgi:hypothetical protein